MMPQGAKPLTEADFRRLKGIDREIIQQANLCRVDSLTGAGIVGRNGHGDYSGILIPYYWPGENDPREYRLRRDHPEMEVNGKGERKPKDKYLSPSGARNMLYFPPGIDPAWLEDPKMSIVLTEGAQKALALHCLAWHDLGEAADRPRWLSFSLSGVDNWKGVIGKADDPDGVRVNVKGVIPDFDRIGWKGRVVKIVFDSDVYSNKRVGDARKFLAIELRKRGAIVSFVDIPKLPEVNGIDDLVARHGKTAVLDRIMSDTVAVGQEPWGEPLPLAQPLPPVEKFDMDLLPAAFRLMVEDSRERMQVPADLTAVPLVTSLSAVVGRRAKIQPKKKDSQWQITPNEWGACIAAPGSMKTPAQRLGTMPLKKLQDAARVGFEIKEQGYKQDCRLFKALQEVWESSVKASVKDKAKGSAIKDAFSNFEEAKSTLPAFTMKELEKPTVPRYIVNDATEPKFQELLAANPGGVLLERDELSGWLAQLDHPDRAGERAFMLEAWEGNGSHHVDRIGRGTTFCDSLCISVIGGIQPSKFRSYASSMLRDDPGSGKANQNDGLLQRIQLLVWPDMDPQWTYVDRKPNEKAVQQVVDIFEQLSRIDPVNPVKMIFDDDAQTMFVEWLSDLEVNELRNTDHHEAFISHLSKYRSLIPSLAGLFELVEMAANGRSFTPEIFIGVESLSRAIRWGRYLKTHAARAYSVLLAPEMQAAQNLGQKIKAGKLGQDRFSVRSVYVKGWSGLSSAHSARAALAILEDSGWVRPVRQEAQPWRPSEEYDINPKVFTDLGTEDPLT